MLLSICSLPWSSPCGRRSGDTHHQINLVLEQRMMVIKEMEGKLVAY